VYVCEQEFSEELRNGLVAYINADSAVLGTFDAEVKGTLTNSNMQ